MDDEAALDVVGDAADELAGTAAQDLARHVATYEGWSVADLVVHTGRIHRWVTEIVRTRATRPLAQPDLARRPDDLINWFRSGAREMIDVLTAARPATAVWTFAGEPTVGFWRRRMALETTIHCWDAHNAFGSTMPIADEVAAAGVTEALAIYIEPRLRGADVGGAGEVVGLRTPDGAQSWTVRLRSDAIDVFSSDHAADVWAEATPTDLWLFLMGRARCDVLDVHGPMGGVRRLEAAVALLPPPAR